MATTFAVTKKKACKTRAQHADIATCRASVTVVFWHSDDDAILHMCHVSIDSSDSQASRV